MTLLNDVMFGLTMTSTLRHLCIVVFYFLLQNFSLILSFCETSLVSFGIKLVKARASAYYLQNSDVNYTSYLCDVKYCGTVVSLTRLRAGCILVLRSDIKWFHREFTRQTNYYTVKVR